MIINFPTTIDSEGVDKKRRDCAEKLGLSSTASWSEIRDEINYLEQINSITERGFQTIDLDEVFRGYK